MNRPELLTVKSLDGGWPGISLIFFSSRGFLATVRSADSGLTRTAASPEDRWRTIGRCVAPGPGDSLRHGPAMVGHTLRGSWRSLVGLESERQAFERYRAIREAAREQL